MPSFRLTSSFLPPPRRPAAPFPLDAPGPRPLYISRYDSASEQTRKKTLDDVMLHREQIVTEIIYLVQDSAPRAASIIFTPVVSRIVDKFIGFCAVVFYWDTLLSSGLPTALGGLDLVMESHTGQLHTFRLTNVNGSINVT